MTLAYLRFRSVLLSMLLIALTACGSAPRQPTSQPPTPSPYSSPPLRSPSPTRQPPPTLRPKPTLTPVPSPLYTPLPTFIHPYDTMRELHLTNALCSLPCWWGIEPGVTTWPEAVQFFNRFGDHAYISEPYRGNPARGISSHYSVSLSPVPPGDDSFSAVFALAGDRIEGISLEGRILKVAGFTPHFLLSTMGRPQSVLVTPHTLVLHFSKSRVIAEFVLTPTDNGDSATFCTDLPTQLTLYAPTQEWTQARLRIETGLLLNDRESEVQTIAADSLLSGYGSRGGVCLRID